jgi:hypothetical protein
MAGEYSRELSSKVFQGACRLIQLGYKQGGTAGYGLRRMLIDEHGNRKGILEMGQQKSIQTDRVILVPGPAEEVDNVRWMYEAFLRDGNTEREIARISTPVAFSPISSVRGRAAQSMRSSPMKSTLATMCTTAPPSNSKGSMCKTRGDRWIRAESAFEGIIDIKTFQAVQAIILARSQKLTDEEMLDRLREV